MAYVSKVWVDRQTEYPTRRKLAFDDGTGDKIVTVSREEGQIYVAGDIFDANTMNNMESRIAAGIGEKQNILIPGNGIRIDQDNVISATGGGGGIEFTKIESGSLVSINDAADLPVVDLAVEIKATQSGTGDPSPSNVRPISGWLSVGVTRAGKNLLDSNKTDLTYVTTTAQRYAVTFEGAGTYAVSAQTLSESRNVYAKVYSGGTYGTSYTVVSGTTATTRTFTLNAGDVLIIYSEFSSASQYERAKEVLSTVQVELGTATSYEPYTGTTVTIALGQTVFGGTRGVTSGLQTVTHKKVVFDGSETGWDWYGAYQQLSLPLDDIAKYIWNQATYICDTLKPVANNDRTGNYGNYASLISSGASVALSVPANSKADALAWLETHNVTFVYELATPVTVQLSGMEVSTLLGINNIYADSGDILNLEYYTQSASDVRDFIIKDEEITTNASWSSDKIQDELDAKQDSLTAGDGIVFDGNEISAVLYKELTATLNVFSTSVVFEDASITTNSVIDIYTSKYGFNPETVTAETGRLTITFRQPDEQITVKVRIS